MAWGGGIEQSGRDSPVLSMKKNRDFMQKWRKQAVFQGKTGAVSSFFYFNGEIPPFFVYVIQKMYYNRTT
jgi:hypothetical protein